MCTKVDVGAPATLSVRPRDSELVQRVGSGLRRVLRITGCGSGLAPGNQEHRAPGEAVADGDRVAEPDGRRDSRIGTALPARYDIAAITIWPMIWPRPTTKWPEVQRAGRGCAAGS
jgi:hypothetical protein